MRIEVTTNAAEVNRTLAGHEKKIRQAAKAALSKVTLQVQHAERIELNREFTVRRAAFMRNRVKVFKFPKTTDGGEMTAVIGIDSRVKGSPLLLAQFEDGGRKSPVQGSRVAIPLTGGKARQVFRKSVPAGYRMDRLQLHTDLKSGTVKGARRTFILPTKNGEFVMFQRGPGGGRSTGPDKDISPLYLFRNHVPLKKRLQFLRIATDLAEQQLPRLFQRYLRLYIKE